MSEILRNARAPAAARLVGSAAVVPGGAVILLMLVFAGLFRSEAAGAVRVWIDSPTFNHCFLILPLTLFLIWRRRTAIVLSEMKPMIWGAVAILILSLIWFVSAFAGGLELRQLLVMTMIQAALLAVFGAKVYRKLAAPLLYLYFLVPSGAFLLPTLQAFTAWFSVAGLHLLGIPVFSTGAVIEIPAGTFAIAEACAGLRFLIASVAFGVFFAIVTYRSLLRRALFVGFSIIVPIVANGFRALGLIAAAEWIGSPAAALADHVLYGWIFFSLVLVILVLIGHLLSDRDEQVAAEKRTAGKTAETRAPLGKMGLTAGLCALSAMPGPLMAAVPFGSEALTMPQSPPRVSAPWRRTIANSGWRPLLVDPSRTFTDRFVFGSYKIDRYIALYRESGRRSNLVRSSNRDADEKIWTFASESVGELFVRGQRIPVHISTWLRGAEKRRVWSFYVVNGRPVAGSISAKWGQLMGTFSERKCVSARVDLSAQLLNGTSDSAGATAFLAVMEPLGPYLCDGR